MRSIIGCWVDGCRINESTLLLMDSSSFAFFVVEQVIKPQNANSNITIFFIFIFIFNLTKTKKFCLSQGHACAVTQTNNVLLILSFYTFHLSV